MKLSSKKTIESALPEYKGVKYTLNKMTQGRRITLELEHSQAMAEIQTLNGQMQELIDPVRGEGWYEKLDAKGKAQLEIIFQKQNLLRDTQINPAWLKIGLNKIEGLEDEDGVPVTPETFTDNVPEDLYKEVLAAIHKEAGLDATEIKN